VKIVLTPWLRVDLDVVDANVERMQRRIAALGMRLRPHVKTHKLPFLALRQIACGAVGITCQKLSEAEVMAAAGVRDILISYELLGEERLRRLRRLRRTCRVAVIADSPAVVAGLRWAAADGPASEPGDALPVCVDCDTGYGRTGVSTPAEAVALAQEIAASPGLRFAGLFTYPTVPATTRPWLVAALQALRAAGLDAEVVSSGGTPGAAVAHQVPELTEYRPGTYVYNDRMMMACGAARLEDCALRVVTAVVAVHGPHRVVLDAGSKALAADLLQGEAAHGHGLIVEYPDARIHRLSEEHGHCDFSACSRLPAVGELVSVVPNHVCTVVNLFDRVSLYRGGRFQGVVSVAARGCSQ
jgi:D-serine deaminase-like pyridoxal phosphate-dependent protein